MGEAFEKYLSNDFLVDCQKQLGGSLFPYKNMVSICFPLLCAGLARLAVVEDLSSALFVGLSYGLIYFLGCPLQIWGETVLWQFLVRRFRATVQHRRFTVSMLVAVPFTI